MIDVSHLSKMYGLRHAISDLNFSVTKGEIVGFLGPNGAGKSTTMKILTGFMPATQGTVKINGFDVFDQPLEVKKNIGFLPETPPVYLEMTVQDYLAFAGQLHQVPKSELSQAVSTAIDKTGLGDVRGRLINNLSKGYRQRVGLAQALIHSPKVLVLDEPTVGLDPKQIIEMRQLIRSLAGHHTVILSSHILPEVTATCQRIIVINKGKIVAEDTIDRLTSRMTKGAHYFMIVKDPSTDGLEALRRIDGVADISAIGPKLTISFQPGREDIRDQLVASAVSKKMGVLEFSTEKVSLEDVFVQLTTVETTESNFKEGAAS